MRITLFPNVSAGSLERHDVPWATLVDRCVDAPTYAAKHNCPLIKLAAFGDTLSRRGALRHDANVVGVSGVEADYDAGVVPPETAAMLLRLAGIEAVVYTSPSHTDAAPRWRVLAPLSTEYPPDTRRAFVARLNGALGGILAGESFTLSQTFFIGRVQGVEYRAIHVAGRPIDQAQEIPVIYPAAMRADGGATLPKRTDANLGELRDALRHIPADDYHEWIAVGQALVELGDEGFELWAEWSAKSERHDGEGDLVRWLTFTGDKTGFAAVFARAQRYGWVNPAARKPLDLGAIGFGPGAAPVLPGAAPALPGAALPPVAMTTELRTVEGARLVLGHEADRVFTGCCYVRSVNKILVPGGDLIDKQRFDATFGGYGFMLDPANTVSAKSAWDAYHRSQCFDFPKVHDVCFRPELAPGARIVESGRSLVNLWWPVETDRTPGDVAPFLDHMTRLLPDQTDRAILLAYMAAVVQYPGVKFQWCPVIQGGEGNGKSFLGYCIEHAVGERYAHRPKASDITNKFTGWLRAKLFICIEEIAIQEKIETLEHLKDLITNLRIEIQGKGEDQVTGDNRANFMMFTNRKDAIPVDVDKRRYSIFYTAQQTAADMIRDDMGGDYFPRLYDWAKTGGYAHISHYLATYPIPAALNPAGACHRAPMTSSTAEAIAVSLGPIEQEIQEAIGRGDPGFCGGWVSSVMLGKLLQGRRVSLQRQSRMVEALGYVLHPGLPDGRACHSIPVPDGARARLWVRPGHLSINETRPAEIARMYQQAQLPTMGGAATAAPGAYSTPT